MDGVKASEKSANEQLPSPFEPLDNLTAKFAAKGLDSKDLVVLSGVTFYFNYILDYKFIMFYWVNCNFGLDATPG